MAEEWVREGDTSGWRKRWESALCNAYQKIDNNLKDEALAPHSAGSTAVVVLLSPCQIIAASCGDSRAVLYRGNQAIPLTVDQKVSLISIYIYGIMHITQYFMFPSSV